MPESSADIDVLARLRTEFAASDGVAASVSVEAADLDRVREDRSGRRAPDRPIAVVYATSIDDVQRLLRLATATHTPVVPRGAGTGLAGGATGGPGAIVLDLSRMNRILELDPIDELAVVEAGVLNGDLNAAAAAHGLWYAPDPASRAISSVGGNIATNAGGLLCAKYGVTREAVLGLAVVLADGRLVRTGRRTVKGVTGYDLTALLTGSEGTLGIIVEATVRLRPRPEGEPVTIAAAFADVEAAAAGCAAVTAARLRPAMLELVDDLGLGRVVDHLGAAAIAGTPVEHLAPGEALVIAQADDTDAAVRAARIAEVLRAAGGRVEVSTDTVAAERLIGLRRAWHPALAATGEVLIEDIAVPRSKLPDMFRVIGEIGRRHGIEIPTLAHAGDGNLHPNFVFTGDEPPAEVWAAADELFRAAVALGGTLTGEHGVGILKRRWLRDELGDDGYDLQRGLKALFDPAGVLNPGVMFDVSNEPRR
ncbi:FAD-binding protein [Agromyces intestinalis]|uniref:FAD-binding protein n=1 Tax=Agromyces intestinalis TaxID=2592652 RepID=A0A5C1YD83_9MICO|nr:FAD-linked oxidase C-terminal domain-containing protein [Agromyces intestinalis]QEO13355.1 FAD-binding protein [Agromyces intestinalis]